MKQVTVYLGDNQAEWLWLMKQLYGRSVSEIMRHILSDEMQQERWVEPFRHLVEEGSAAAGGEAHV